CETRTSTTTHDAAWRNCPLSGNPQHSSGRLRHIALKNLGSCTLLLREFTRVSPHYAHTGSLMLTRSGSPERTVEFTGRGVVWCGPDRCSAGPVRLRARA